MLWTAIRMLMGDLGKYLGMLFGVTFAAFLMTQQGSIFWGLMSRTFGFVTETNQPQLWVMDKRVQFVEDLKPLSETTVNRIRGIDGVEWAMPLYRGLIRARLSNGVFQQCWVVGIDDTTFIGAPQRMLEGRIEDLRRAEAVIVNEEGANGLLARRMPDGSRIPLKVGDTLELNDRRALVVGICRTIRTFQTQPVIYTTYSRAVQYAPRERKILTYVVAGLKPEADMATVQDRIDKTTGLKALSQHEFQMATLSFFLRFTGIPINFGISVVLGFVVGAAICGQTFYQFTSDNIRQFGALKAMGAGNSRLLGMILLQAGIVGVQGYGLGVGLAALFGLRSGLGQNTLAFNLTWIHLGLVGVAVLLITMIAAALSLVKVMRTEPAIVFKG